MHPSSSTPHMQGVEGVQQAQVAQVSASIPASQALPASTSLPVQISAITDDEDVVAASGYDSEEPTCATAAAGLS